MEKIRICIVDDEKLARSALSRLIAGDKGTEVVGEAGSGREAVKMLKKHKPHLVFLDIKMPGMDGFEVLSKLHLDPSPAVVFVTAYDNHALRAFEVHALDYLLKPFDDAAFFRVLDRAKRQIIRERVADFAEKLAALSGSFLDNTDPADSRDKGSERYNRIAVKVGGQIKLIAIADILCVSAAEHYCKIHLDSQHFLVRESISGLQDRLPPLQFYRIHRSTIVNISRVKEISPIEHGDYEVILDNGLSYRMSRRRSQGLKLLLNS